MPGEVLGVPPVFAVPPPGTMVLGVPPAIGVARPPVVTVLGVGRDSVAPLPPGTMVLGMSTAIGVARPPVVTVLGAVLPPTEPQFMAITAPTAAAPTPPIIRPPLSIVTTVRAVITAVVGPRLERRPPRESPSAQRLPLPIKRNPTMQDLRRAVPTPSERSILTSQGDAFITQLVQALITAAVRLG